MFATPRKGKKDAKSGTKGRRKALTTDEAKALLKELVPPKIPKKAIPMGKDIQEKDAVQKTITLICKESSLPLLPQAPPAPPRGKLTI